MEKLETSILIMLKNIVMVGGGRNQKSAQGVNIGYQAFLAFKKVKEALIAMSRGEGNYSYDGNIYKRPITTSRALQILMKIEECRWDDDIRTGNGTTGWSIGAYEYD